MTAAGVATTSSSATLPLAGNSLTVGTGQGGYAVAALPVAPSNSVAAGGASSTAARLASVASAAASVA